MAQVYIHVGPHKCGTTAFQELVFENKSLLNQFGVYVPDAGVNGGAIAHHNLAWQLFDEGIYNSEAGGWDELFDEIADKDKVLITSEAFSSFPGQYNTIVDSLTSRGHSVCTLFVFRHQIEIINSAYTQRIKTYNIFKSFDEYFENALLENRYRYDVFYKNFITTKANPIVLKYNRESLIDDLFKAIGVDSSQINRNIDRKKMNISPLAHEVEMLRVHSSALQSLGVNFKKAVGLLSDLRSTTTFKSSFWGFSHDQFVVACKKYEKHNAQFYKTAGMDEATVTIENRSRSQVVYKDLVGDQCTEFDTLSKLFENAYSDTSMRSNKNRLGNSDEDRITQHNHLFKNQDIDQSYVNRLINWHIKEKDTHRCVELLKKLCVSKENRIRELLNLLIYDKHEYSLALEFVLTLGENKLFHHIPTRKLADLFDITTDDMRWGDIFRFIDSVEPHLALAGIYRTFANSNNTVDSSKHTNALLVQRGASKSHSENTQDIGADRTIGVSGSGVKIREFNDVQIVGFSFGFSIFDNDGRPLGVDAVYTNRYATELVNDQDSVRESLDSIVFFGDRFRPNNYCHFVVDHLPRILHLSERYTGYDYAAFGYENNNFQKQYLELADFKENVLNLKPGVVYRIKKLALLNSSLRAFVHCFQGGSLPYAKPLQKFSHKVPINLIDVNPLVFLKRTKQLGRCIVNEFEVESFLERKGFSILDIGNYSLVEQISIMKSAKVVIGIHGAALTNLFYCESGTEVVEIFPPNYGTKAFEIISNMLGHKYLSIIGDPSHDSRRTGTNTREDLYLNIGMLESVVRGLDVETGEGSSMSMDSVA